ncbi:exopolysaccharide biosynthesis protein [Desulfoscipio gibsoniae]|uniref:Putative ABC-type transport system, permease component n=1 Tax=Desulfoscipio gibsoniae DSM 7213 TaxID=767817 RepID=R4KF50_9FIRM|nr:exopolysaccharide biosynthesis protein [Desulfoscipio gibsoniae]AGL01219.1 putative ABC-type transport system, permease component [Desulfoscipio gibsoniae DSM 7213]
MSCPSGSKPPSEIIRDTIGKKECILTVEDLINAFGSQSFGLMFIVMALPLTIPLPPGIGFIPAALLCVWSFQRMLGRTTLWVPKAIGKREISQTLIRKIDAKALPLCARLERYFLNCSQPNMLNESEIRLASLAVVLMSMLIMLPTPFLNTIPAVIIILMGLTILNSNRRLLWINMSFSLLALSFIGSTLYVGSEFVLEEISDFLKANPSLLD